LASRIPDTDRVSWVIEPIAASDAWASRRALRRARPTRRLNNTNTGFAASEMAVNSGDSTSIATTEDTSVTTLLTTDDAVEVIVVCTPPT
jgi:hypothetical protein